MKWVFVIERAPPFFIFLVGDLLYLFIYFGDGFLFLFFFFFLQMGFLNLHFCFNVGGFWILGYSNMRGIQNLCFGFVEG